MIRTITAALVLTSCTPVFANGTMPDGTDNIAGWCNYVYNAAAFVMIKRQENHPMPDMLNKAKGTATPEVGVYYTVLVFNAYDTDAKLSPIRQEEAVLKFANEQYLKCLRNGGKI